jgi:SAM-dependent methyltransferase
MEHKLLNNEERHLYNSSQWVWDMIGTVEDYGKLAGYIAGQIRNHERIRTKTLLHLGCGSGCIDHHLKGPFTVTGVDLSEKMLESARLKNPECEYIHGDMRDFQSDRVFDAVIIPESINYMLSEKDISNVFKNVKKALKKNGLLLVIVGYDPGNFPQDRTTVERVADKDKEIELTFIENNYTTYPQSNSFEATFVFLIRNQGKLEIETDIHILGLFEKETFDREMTKAGFKAGILEDPYLEEIEQEGSWLLLGHNK